MQNWSRILALSGVIAGLCPGQPHRQSSSREDQLRSAVQNYLRSPPLRNFDPTPYLFAFVNLNGGGEHQAVVYLTGQGWCGSSGCHMLVLNRESSSYKVLCMIPGVRLPIRVLESKSHKWHDLAVFIQGGGILRGYEEILRFDGNDYSGESSDVGEGQALQHIQGKVVLSWKNKEVALYP